MPEIPTAEFNCLRCAADIKAQLPQHEIVNALRFSIVVLTHERPVVCPGCKQVYTYMINGVQGFTGGFVGVETQPTSDIVPPPPGFDPNPRMN